MNGAPASHRRQGGIALLMVMVIVALATLLATELVRQQQLQVHRGGNLLHGDQAFEYALGGEVWARRLLLKDAADSSHDSLDEFWNQGLPPTPIPGGTISGRLRGLQGRFNLNNLQAGQQPDTLWNERFERLLKDLDLPDGLRLAAVDWIDADSEVQPGGGAEDDFYSRLPEPYRAANRPFADVSELHLLRGVSSEIYATLLPQVTVLPDKTQLNVNTAPGEMLQALGLSSAEAEAVIAARDKTPFKTLDAFTGLPVIAAAIDGGDFDDSALTVSSEYFELEVAVAMGDQRLVQYSLLKRDGKDTVTVLARRRRGW